MDLHQLRCFIVAAEELHFGRAAQQMGMLPAALGRFIRLLEEDLGTRLMVRTTRNVALTEEGRMLLEEARPLLAQADALEARIRARSRQHTAILRVGAIDSAAAGLLPLLLQDLRAVHPEITIQIVEDKTIRLLPRLLSGRLELAFVRPPESRDRDLEFRHLFFETAVVAVSTNHALSDRVSLSIHDLENQPLIVPDRRSRPHSYDLTIKLFAEAGLRAQIAQIAEEKQTIVNLVAADLGIAIVPRWTARMNISGVRFIPLETQSTSALQSMNKLPLSAVWIRGARDPSRDLLLETLRNHLDKYAALA